MEDMLMRLAGNIGIVNLPFISFVFKKDDIDKIANDSDTYQRLLTSKCPMSVIREIVLYMFNRYPAVLCDNSYHAFFYDDNDDEINKRIYISDCLEERVSDNEIATIQTMLSNGNSDITKYILSIFLRRILKTNGEISEIDELVANTTPLEQITTQMMSKYNLRDKIPHVELNKMVFAVINAFVPLVILNNTVRFTKRSPIPITFRVCSKQNDDSIPVGNIVIPITGIPAYLDDNPKYIWGAGIDHRCCRIRDFAIDFFEKLNKSKNPN